MLSGRFSNCYGLEDFSLPTIEFQDNQNIAAIYAPNGVMKSSLAEVLDNISKGVSPRDRVFEGLTSTFEVNYNGGTYSNDNNLGTDCFYVVKSFDEKFTASNESISLLLADAETKAQYDTIASALNDDIRGLTQNLSAVAGIRNHK